MPGFSSEDEDWAFSIEDEAADKLPLAERLRRERIRTSCLAKDRVGAAECLAARPAHRRGAAEFLFACKPMSNTTKLAERGRRMLSWKKPGNDVADAAQEAVDLALSWGHADSIINRHPDRSSESHIKEVGVPKRKVAVFEPEGIIQRLRYWRRFSTWASSVGIMHPQAATADEVRRFFCEFSSPIPTLPRSIWNAMVWVGNHLGAPINIPRDAKPVLQAASASAEDGQVPAAPPELVRRLDWLLRESLQGGGGRVRLLMGVLVMIISWMRFRHLQRSIPTSLTKQLLWVMVTRSKRPDGTGARRGYRSAIPRFSPCGVDVGQFLWNSWHSASESRGKAQPGLIIDTEGGIISLRAFNVGVQRIIANSRLTPTPELVTSYSWRRGTDSMGEARGLDPVELSR